MQTSFTIATFRGVPIKIDLSLVILAIWLGIEARDFLLGIITALLLVTSVALHELGHTAVALNYGCRVRDITLMLIGGRATMLDIPRAPLKEFWMAIAGPAVSAALWIGGSFLARILDRSGTVSGGIAGSICYWLAWMNRGLFFFNLIPAFPMDGGRVLRAILATRLGRLRATYIASRIGRLLAIVMGIWGLFGGGFMLLIIAYFIFNAADAEYRMVAFEEGGGFFGRGGFFGGGFGGGGGGFFGGGRGGWRGGSGGDNDVYVSPPPYGRDR